jgi:hypothetical protein
VRLRRARRSCSKLRALRNVVVLCVLWMLHCGISCKVARPLTSSHGPPPYLHTHIDIPASVAAMLRASKSSASTTRLMVEGSAISLTPCQGLSLAACGQTVADGGGSIEGGV